MVKRKIGFYNLFLMEKVEGNEVYYSVEDGLTKTLSYLLSIEPIQRKFDLFNDKFAFIDDYAESQGRDNNPLLRFLFKSARHGYRAPLLNRETVELRDNPKTLEEGEQIKTHGLIKIKDGNAILFLETGLGMLTCKNVVDYLNNFIQEYNFNLQNGNEPIRGSFCFDMIPRDDFREVLAKMQRVALAEVFVDKEILGNDFLNFSKPSAELKEQITLSLKSEPKRDITQHVYDILDKCMGADSKIRRIRVKGILPNNNECIIDTGFIIKKEYVDAQQNEDTGEYNTVFMFEQLKKLSEDY